MPRPRSLAPIVLLLLPACIPSMRSSFREGRELVEQAVDARELHVVELDGDVGDVELATGADDSVRVRVTLRSSDAERLARECLPKSELIARRDGGTLALRVEQHTRNRCGARWLVTVPPRLDARVRLDVGTVRVTGLTGGIDVAASKGDITVESRAPSHGRVSLRSDVGRVSARVRGYEVPRGTRHGAGDALTIRGEGGPTIDLRTQVGNATLVIAEP